MQAYDHLAAGNRIRAKRLLLGFTQDEMAEKIDRACKYYADIERGSCGMSVETLLALSHALDMSLDYIITGNVKNDREGLAQTDETTAILEMLDHADAKKRRYAMKMLKLFLAAWE